MQSVDVIIVGASLAAAAAAKRLVDAGLDVVIIEKRETAENGQSVVAMIGGEQVTLKKFYVERDGVRLQPANPYMDPIYFKNEEVQILGIVTGVIRSVE